MKCMYKVRGNIDRREIKLGRRGGMLEKIERDSDMKDESARWTWRKRHSRVEVMAWTKTWQPKKGSWCVCRAARSPEWLELRVIWGGWLGMRPGG